MNVRKSLSRRSAPAALLLLLGLTGAAGAAELLIPAGEPRVIAEPAAARVLGLAVDASNRSLLTYEDLSDALAYETYAQAAGPTGLPVGEAVSITTSNSFALEEAVVATVAGGFVAVWEDAPSSSIRQRRFAPDGMPAGPVEEVRGPEDGTLENPSVTALPDGGWLAAWVEYPSSLEECCRISGRRYLPSGQAAGPAFPLHTDATFLPRDVAVAAGTGGSLVLFWSASPGISDARGLYARRLGASGAPVGGVIEVLPARPEYTPAFPAAAVASNGDFLLTWRAVPDGTFVGQIERVEALGFRADGTPASDLLVYQPSGTRNEPYPSRDPSVAALPDGRFALALETIIPYGDPLLPESRSQIYLLILGGADGEVESIQEVGAPGGSRPKLAAGPGVRARLAWFGPLEEGGLPAVLLQDFAPVCSGAPADICLQDGRFRVEVDWETIDGQGNVTEGIGTPRPLTPESAAFWFFREENLELFVKILDACEQYDRYWVFLAGLTNVEVDVTVTDTATGEVRTYNNPQKTPFQPIYDTQAFATCGGGMP